MVVVCPYCRTKVETGPGALWVRCSACKERIDLSSLGTTPGVPAFPAEQGLEGSSVGGYKLEKLIGIGGMGVVYRASREDGRPVAVKILAYGDSGNESIVRRFERETRILASLDHPGIVRLIDSGSDEGLMYIVMEYVPLSLAEKLKGGPLPLAEIRRIFVEVADALAHAHGRGIVHRDLKPTNILLAPEGAMITDFGIAHLEYERDVTSLTRTSAVLGTFNYMSPEQRMGEKDIDRRADIYAMGVLLYELITGKVPIGRFPPASSVRKEIPRKVDAVIGKALSQDRAGRHDDVRALRDDFLGALASGAGKTGVAVWVLVFLLLALGAVAVVQIVSTNKPGSSPQAPPAPDAAAAAVPDAALAADAAAEPQVEAEEETGTAVEEILSLPKAKSKKVKPLPKSKPKTGPKSLLPVDKET
jgi:LSD1 subclass zinc finger protein